MHKISVGIIDDHEVVSAGLASELARQGFEIRFSISERAALLSNLEQGLPDVLIMDVVMPGSVSIEAFKEVLSHYPDAAIIAYTALNSPTIIELLIRSGVKGYLNKNQSLSEIFEAIQKVHAGHLSLPQEYEFILKKLGKTESPAELSKREIEILRLIAQEKTTTEISKELFISVSTVETHRKNLFQKLNVTNLAGLIRQGIHLGYLH
jgi:DNA-binding NarL/FixJ family response regulator